MVVLSRIWVFYGLPGLKMNCSESQETETRGIALGYGVRCLLKKKTEIKEPYTDCLPSNFYLIRKHHYAQSLREVIEFQLSYFKS